MIRLFRYLADRRAHRRAELKLRALLMLNAARAKNI